MIERCSERNIPMYRTDLQGAVHAVSDGQEWTVTTQWTRKAMRTSFFGDLQD
ncbi:MAG: hypothetical protein WAN11_11760 [Syntrophobacteraceae bacterium]